VKLNSGKLLILVILAAALGAAGLAWWHQYQQGRRALTYWGPEGAALIRTAPRVELLNLSLEPLPQSSGERVFDRFVTRRQDISKARGLVHARQALISDASFEWGEPASSDPNWTLALHFSDGGREIVVAFDLSRRMAQSTRNDTPVQVGSTLAAGLQAFIAEQTPPERP
jgi:hypothetical protein